MQRCLVLKRRERLGREHAGHALDLRHDGLEEVLAGVRADAGHDVLVAGRADDLLDLGDVLQRAHGLLRVCGPNEEVRVAGVPIFLTRRPVLECRIAPEPSDVVPCLDLGREGAQLGRVTEAARDGDIVTPEDGLGLRHVGLGAEGNPAISELGLKRTYHVLHSDRNEEETREDAMPVTSSKQFMDRPVPTDDVEVRVFLPDSCLQGTELPAHVLWGQRARVEIRIIYPKSLKLAAVYNVRPSGLATVRKNEIEIRDFEVDGYVGILFKTELLSIPKQTERVVFRVRSRGSTKWSDYPRTVELFRPFIRVERIPDSMKVNFHESDRTYDVRGKIRLRNEGDGTAVIVAKLGSKSDFQKGPPQGSEDFEKAFVIDAEPRLKSLSSEWPAYSALISDFLELLRAPLSLQKSQLEKIESVFRRLADAARESEPFFSAFLTILVVSYLRNVRIITEVKSLMDYLNSIGKGRVVLMNSVEVLKPSKAEGALNLVLEMTDLAYNDYEPIEIGPIRVECPTRSEIPVHLLFDWIAKSEGSDSTVSGTD